MVVAYIVCYVCGALAILGGWIVESTNTTMLLYGIGFAFLVAGLIVQIIKSKIDKSENRQHITRLTQQAVRE